ncbi:hypothetical protein [Pseudophaeobacter sp.]|jgi:hypothetical protein|uniref:Uncharacterized protein n=1 Tax=Pseudophaeobacter arcticus TaxID=385492 RepID=A0ABQ0ARH1_9RHOB
MSYKLKLIAYLLLVPLTIPLVLQMSVLPLQFAMGFNLIPEDQLWVLYLFLACAVVGLTVAALVAARIMRRTFLRRVLHTKKLFWVTSVGSCIVYLATVYAAAFLILNLHFELWLSALLVGSCAALGMRFVLSLAKLP